MKTQGMLRTISMLVTLAALLATSAPHAIAAPPPAPMPVSPAEGSTIVIPTFSWQASSGAAKYEIEVGPQSDPNTVYWSAETVQPHSDSQRRQQVPPIRFSTGACARKTAATSPEHGAARSTSPRSSLPQRWSARPMAAPLSYRFEWQIVQGAAYYKVELSTSATFIVMEATYTTYNTRITPVDTSPMECTTGG